MVDIVRDNLQEQRPSRGDQFAQVVLLSTVLDAGAMEAQFEILEHMIVDGLDVNTRSEEGQTLLHWAAQAGHLDAVELLIRNGADPNIADRSGKTPLRVAREKGHRQVADFLRRHGEKG